MPGNPYTGRHEAEFLKFLQNNHIPEMQVTFNGMQRRLNATLDGYGHIILTDPHSGKGFGSISAHRYDCFQNNTNSYDNYIDIKTHQSVRTLLGI